jgi:nicotinamide mononucleotide transporter
LNWFQPVFNLFDYPVSFIELISVFSGITGVYLAAKEKILTWPIGLINISTAFFIYFRVQLYSDMFLQCYFFGISIYGWYFWKKEKKEHIPLKWMHNKERILWVIAILISTLLFGYLISRLHEWLPSIFPISAAYPYADTLVAIMSILANTLLAKRIIENWILWIFVDLICVYLYIQKGILFISFEFLIFLGIAIFGLIEWIHLKRIQTRISELH